jgi:hypothetical protein
MVRRKWLPSNLSVLVGTSGQRKARARRAGSGEVMASRPKNGAGTPSFSFWSNRTPIQSPRFSVSMAPTAASRPLASGVAL